MTAAQGHLTISSHLSLHYPSIKCAPRSSAPLPQQRLCVHAMWFEKDPKQPINSQPTVANESNNSRTTVKINRKSTKTTVQHSVPAACRGYLQMCVGSSSRRGWEWDRTLQNLPLFRHNFIIFQQTRIMFHRFSSEFHHVSSENHHSSSGNHHFSIRKSSFFIRIPSFFIRNHRFSSEFHHFSIRKSSFFIRTQ